ncbi:MAG: hypothetical protein JNM56_28450 [Planctomycetia bacterium]|nr:hypothetical protein [Planctomycetia bacterium]
MSTVQNKSDKMLYILLAGAGLMVVVCLGLFGYGMMYFVGARDGGAPPSRAKRPNQTYPTGEGAATLNPDQVVRAFFKEVGESQFEDAYQRTSTSFQGQMSQNDFNEFLRKNSAFIGHLSLTYSTSGQTDTGVRKYKGKAFGGENGGVSFSLELSHEDEGWRVRSITVP